MIERVTHYADTGTGWRLLLRQVVDTERRNPDHRPVAIVPGYGMNSFIIGYHPDGPSMEEYLASAGFEVWSINLRGQEGSVYAGTPPDYGMRDLSLVDLGTALAYIAAQTASTASGIDVIGCSLGGSMVFTHLALVPDSAIHAVVALGAPLRWVEVHPLVKTLFSSPWLARNLRFKGARKIASVVLPVLEAAPWLLGIYLHPNIVDMDKADQLVRTVEDPNPVLNEQIVRWIKNEDLIIDGANVTEKLRPATNPIMVLTGNADGIVPRATAKFVLDWIASEDTTFMEVGDAQRQFAHADLYVSRYSQELVFAPIAKWLTARYDA